MWIQSLNNIVSVARNFVNLLFGLDTKNGWQRCELRATGFFRNRRILIKSIKWKSSFSSLICFIWTTLRHNFKMKVLVEITMLRQFSGKIFLFTQSLFCVIKLNGGVYQLKHT